MSTVEKIESEVINVSKKLASLIDPQDWNLPNCSAPVDFFDQPPARIFLKNLEPSQKILIAIATGLEVFILMLAFIHWRQIWTKVSSEKRQNKLYYLISLFPVASLCCYIGMLAPRTSLILNSIGVLYALVCLAVLISLIKHLFGGRKAFSTALSYDNKPINLQSPPCCCCCKFLPQPSSSEKNLRRLEWVVLQAPIVRALVVVFNVVAVAEFREESQIYLRISDIAAVASLLLSIFGMHTMARLTADKLRSYGFMTIFRTVDITLLFYTAQQPMIFENLIRISVIGCGPTMSAIDNGRFICNFVIICELTLLSILATFRISPNRSALFDKVYSEEPKLQVKIDERTDLQANDYDA